jgi:RHS repeat-associated protein
MSDSIVYTLCRYFYDPLDQLSGVGQSQTAIVQRFYQQGRLATETSGSRHRTLLGAQTMRLAQLQDMPGSAHTKLLLTDGADSILQTSSNSGSESFAYNAYGYHPDKQALSQLLGFVGECPDGMTGHYPLGQGHRFYNPILMRFNSPDEWSPFDEGGLNPYAYCENDPVNYSDPDGRWSVFRPWNVQNTINGTIPRISVAQTKRVFKPWNNPPGVDLRTGRQPNMARYDQIKNPAPRPVITSPNDDLRFRPATLTLPPTQLRPKRSIHPVPSTEYRRNLASKAALFDQFENTNRGPIPLTTSDQRLHQESLIKELNSATAQSHKDAVQLKLRHLENKMKAQGLEHYSPPLDLTTQNRDVRGRPQH